LLDFRLETERLVLRHVKPDDALFIWKLYNTPDFIRFIGDKGLSDLNKAGDYIRDSIISSYDKNGFGLYLVEVKDEAIPIGLCGILKRDEKHVPDIGFALLPEFYRLGYTFEAAVSVLRYAREKLELPVIRALVHPENTASRALLKKIGIPEEQIVISV
jgi:[ribosomal protein S5]-alanine N-acetyltransferase